METISTTVTRGKEGGVLSDVLGKEQKIREAVKSLDTALSALYDMDGPSTEENIKAAIITLEGIQDGKD